MKINKKFKQIALTAALLSVNTFVFAADNGNSMSNDNMKDAKMKQKTMAPSLGDKMPPYPSPTNFVVDASFIYWQADVEDLDAGLQGNFSLDTTVGSKAFGLENHLKAVKRDYKWEPGFKFGIGLVYGERDQYDVMLNWTWIQPEGTAKSKTYPQFDTNSIESGSISTFLIALVRELESGAAIPGNAPLYSGGPAANIESKWKMQYNTVDLEFGRNFFLGKNLTLRPHMGLRGAWINQRLDDRYVSILGPLSVSGANIGVNNLSTIGFGTNTQHAKDEYHAVGLRAGADVYWNFTNHFAAYGKVSGSILYGYEKVDHTFSVIPVATLSGLNSSVLGNSLDVDLPLATLATFSSHTTKTTLQGILGLMWHTGFEDSGCHFYASAGYEVNQWFHLNNFRTFNEGLIVNQTATPRKGDVGLHGLTIDLRLDF